MKENTTHFDSLKLILAIKSLNPYPAGTESDLPLPPV